jgi:ABC-type transporter Mla maintaining outer membrane lipid asymmetry ATPase subunit MlaF/voltage-gated potassium channel Kch
MILSMLSAPLIIQYAEPIVRKLTANDWLARAALLTQIAAKTMSRQDHIIICGYGRSGQNLARLLEAEDIPYLALDSDPERVRVAAADGGVVVYGDASRREALTSAGLFKAKAVVITFADVPIALKILHIVQELRPELPVVVRTVDDSELPKLMDAGAAEVVPEVLEGSLMLASHALLLLGVPLNRVLKRIRTIREERYGLFRGFFHGATDACRRCRQRAAELHSVVLSNRARAVGMTLLEVDLGPLVEVSGVAVAARARAPGRGFPLRGRGRRGAARPAGKPAAGRTSPSEAGPIPVCPSPFRIGQKSVTDRESLRRLRRKGYNPHPPSMWVVRVTAAASPQASTPACPTENAVVLDAVTYGYDPRRPVLRGIDMTIPRGKVVAIMGGSGCGKTTILRLIGGQLQPQAGRVLVAGQSVPDMDRDALYAMRRKIGMLFQFGALFTDLDVFENIAFTLREHTNLPDELIRDLVLMKLNAVGLRGTAQLQPRNCRRHGAPRGARARDRAGSHARALRRAVRRPRSHLAGRGRTADPGVERRTGNHVGGGHARRLRIAEDRRLPVFRVRGTHHSRRERRSKVRASQDPFVRQFVDGAPDGPVPFHYPAPKYADELAPMPAEAFANGLRRVGAGAINAISRLGFAARFFAVVLIHSPAR